MPQLNSLSKLQRIRWARILWNAIESYDKDGCLYMAGALSFYAMLSLIPLAFAAMWGLTALVGSSADAQRELEQLLRQYLLPGAAHAIMERVKDISGVGILSIVGSWWGLLAFTWSGISFYETLHTTLSTAWGGGQVFRFFRRKLLTLMAFLGSCLFFGLTLIVTAAVTAVKHIDPQVLGMPLGHFWIALGYILPFLFTIGMCFLLYKSMPSVFVPWRLALSAAIPVGIAWEAGKWLFAALLAHRNTYSSLYGPMAGFVLLMVWVYYSSTVVLFGAEAAAAWQKDKS